MVIRNSTRWALAGALTLASFAACDGDPVSQDLAATESPVGAVQVVLTEPFCDVCESSDKYFLLGRSPILHEVIGLIDGAKETLDVAQYTFSRKEIRDAIIRAKDRGVRVRVAMDVAQDRPGSRSTDLKEAGVDLRFVSGSQGGLMHAKFMVVDAVTVLTGSNNFSSTGVSINEENTMIIRGKNDKRVVGIACQFEAIWVDSEQDSAACSNSEVAFSPSSKGRNLVRDQLRGAKKSIDVIVHHMTYMDLVDELIDAAKNRGVEVRLIINVATAEEHGGPKFQQLIAAGGQIRLKRHNEGAFQLLHHKLAIVDGRTLVNGSGNWSGSGFFRNYENVALYREPHVLARMRDMYHRLWTWSLDAASLSEGITAAEQHQRKTRHFFGNLHAHFDAQIGGVSLDDGEPIVLDESGAEVPVAVPADLPSAAVHAYEYAEVLGELDFMALTPHTREDSDDDVANMSHEGYQALREVAESYRSAEFLSLAGMEWSSNSTGNHLGIIGSSQLSKVTRGRYDTLYNEFLVTQARAGERVFVMLNHPKTFRLNQDVLEGSWDMIYGISLLDVPKSGDRKKKFNDFGIDDFAPVKDVLPSWIDGTSMPDPSVVEESWKAILYAAGDHIRMMEVTLNRGNEFGQEIPKNPSIVPSKDDPEVMVRRTKVHTDFDYFLTRGFRIAPVASHDNHLANWGTGHTSRTVAIADGLRERAFLDAVEFRQIYASEDQNLSVQLYAEGRDPMGSVHRTRSDSVSATLWLDDPDYTGTYTIRVFQGKVGEDGVVARQELPEVSPGTTDLSFSVPEAAMHFVYLEIYQTETDRMTWTSPLWIDHLTPAYTENAYPHGSGRLVGDAGEGGGGAGGEGGGGVGGDDGGGVNPAGNIVINEIDYDQPSSDTGEFVELLNTSSVPIDLGDLVLIGVNGKNSKEYMRVDLSAAGTTLEPGQYLVVGTSSALFGVPDTELTVKLPKASNNIQNGAPDAIGIFDLASGALLDAISYEGEVIEGEINGFGSFSFVEGSVTDLADSNATVMSFSRSPNGSDTNDAFTDWVSSAPSPGLANP